VSKTVIAVDGAPRPFAGAPYNQAVKANGLVFCAGHNMTESSLLDRDAIVQVFLMFTIALIHLETRPPPTQRPLRRAALRGQSVRHAPSHA